MHRFFFPFQNISVPKIILRDKKQIHHLRVLRLKVKDKVVIFDEKNNEYTCLIRDFSNQQVVFEIKEKQTVKIPKMNITVACAIPKKSKIDEIIDKLTQLGVDRIIPLETQRVMVKLDPKKKQLRLLRWRKIAENASQQSQRNRIPIVEPIQNIKEVLAESSGFNLKLIPTLMGQRRTLKEVLEQGKPKNILILIGPEGDFTPEEIDLAIKAGCIPVTLGELVLRVETAAIAVVSFIKLYLYEYR